MKKIKNILHLLTFRMNDKVQIESYSESEYIGFNGTIKQLNLTEGTITIKSNHGSFLKLNNITDGLYLKKK